MLREIPPIFLTLEVGFFLLLLYFFWTSLTEIFSKRAKIVPQSSEPWNSFCYVEFKEKDEKHNPSPDIKNDTFLFRKYLRRSGFWVRNSYVSNVLILGCIGLNSTSGRRRKVAVMKWVMKAQNITLAHYVSNCDPDQLKNIFLIWQQRALWQSCLFVGE